jgi:hypothetical protein
MRSGVGRLISESEPGASNALAIVCRMADEPKTGREEDARQAALDAWAKQFGDRPNTRAEIRKVHPDALVPQNEPDKKQGDALNE